MQVAACVMGSPEPLPVLVKRLVACMASTDAGKPVTDMLVQNTILELASRKSYGVKDGAPRAISCITVCGQTHLCFRPLRSLHELTTYSWWVCNGL